MSRQAQTRGVCAYCGKSLTRSGMAKHLPTCPKRQALLERAPAAKEQPDEFAHLHVYDAWSGSYWLQLELSTLTTLKKLDQYLRAIWLECCGHLSQFSVGGWRGAEIAMRRKLGEVMRPGVELTHIYDFGSSTETRIKLVGVRYGLPLSPHPITLMARNDPPFYQCSRCEQAAVAECQECAFEGKNSLYCAAHLADEPHAEDDEALYVSIVNSPRVGVCGYQGPSEPPY